MATYRWIPITDSSEWDTFVTEAAGPCDTSHFAAYHEVAQSLGDAYVGGGGVPFLFAYEDGDLRIAVPLLRRTIARIPGLESFDGWYDATNAYGYPGLLVNCRDMTLFQNGANSQDVANPQDGTNPQNGTNTQALLSPWDQMESQESTFWRHKLDERERFQRAFFAAMRELRIVSFFGRGNPLIPGEVFWYEGMADVRRTGRTVAMDLTLPDSDQLRQMRRDTRARLRQAIDAGVTVRRSIPSPNGSIPADDLTHFIRLYECTMRSVGAAAGYYFDRSYYESLFRRLGPSHTALLFSEYEDAPIAGAIFLLSGTAESHPPGAAIIQYHLSGSVTDERTRRFGGGTRPILDHMRRWGREHGYRWLHMGGGVGGRGPGDSLFDFKAGFSRRSFDFYTVRWITDPERYGMFVDRGGSIQTDFFPRYRWVR